MMCNFSCPKGYEATKELRAEALACKPDDFTRSEMYRALQNAIPTGTNIEKAIVVQEFHERRMPVAPFDREMHYHALITLSKPQTPMAISKKLTRVQIIAPSIS